jgi:hypothetical protein
MSELSRDKLKEIASAMDAAIGVFVRGHQQIPPEMAAIAAKAHELLHGYELLDKAHAHQKANLDLEAAAWKANEKAVESYLKHLPIGAGLPSRNMSGVVPQIGAAAKSHGNLAFVDTHPTTLFARMFGSSQQFAQQMSQTIMGAMQGGGNVVAAASGMVGSRIGTHIAGALKKDGTKMFTGALGGVFSAALPVVGSLIGPLAEKIWGSLFGTAGRDKVKDFAATFGGFDALHAKLNALPTGIGETLWKNLTQGVGRNNPAEAKAAIDAINKALNLQTSETQALVDTATKYGLTWKDAGDAAKTAHLDEVAQGLIDDFARLTKGGYEVVAVEEHMSASVNSYLQDAIAMGREVPAAMRPMLEEMAKHGQLTDAAGNKITDLQAAGITFAETMTQGFKGVSGAINRLGDILLGLPGLAGKAAAGINSALGTIKDRKVTVHVATEGDTGDSNTAATGGLVTARGIQHFARGGVVGTDTVPAMLTPGEIVLNAAQQANLAHVLATMSADERAALDKGYAAERLAGFLGDQVQYLVEQFQKYLTEAEDKSTATTWLSGQTMDAVRMLMGGGVRDTSTWTEGPMLDPTDKHTRVPAPVASPDDAAFLAAHSPGRGSHVGDFVQLPNGAWVPKNHPAAVRALGGVRDTSTWTEGPMLPPAGGVKDTPTWTEGPMLPPGGGFMAPPVMADMLALATRGASAAASMAGARAGGSGSSAVSGRVIGAAGGGGGINIHAGAIVIDRPIFKDREAIQELAVEVGKQLKNALGPTGMW